MNITEKNVNEKENKEQAINEEILENVSGGRPIGRDGKPVGSSEYRNRKENDGIHVTSATY